MRKIEKQNWPRLEHYEFFSTFNHPHFNMCANLDLTKFYPFIKRQEISFTIALVYMISRTANAIPEFRYRIRGDDIVEHEIVNPSLTILLDNDLFTFCSIDYDPDFNTFAERASRKIAEVKIRPTLKDPPGRDDLLLMTALPWVAFTSFTHPMRLHPADSNPRFAWGKFFEEGKRIKMPLSVQAHHAVMDGLHMGRYYGLIQDDLDQAQVVLGPG
jgi:chloramphenicol O-acetyltransferase type A